MIWQLGLFCSATMLFSFTRLFAEIKAIAGSPGRRISLCVSRALVVTASFSALISTRADLFPKIEASFAVTNLVTDPFDYAATDVRVQIAQPNGATNSLPAFFDGGTTWRVRHAPPIGGVYQVVGVTMNGAPVAVSNLQPVSWTVAGTPFSPGYIRVDPGNSNKFITANGRRHFPLGHNLAWWTNNTQLGDVVTKLGGSRENWSRIWMMHFYDSLNLEWPKVGAFGQFSLPVAQKWDAIVSAAEQAGVSFQMVLQHHGQYSSTVDPNWAQNPYNTANGGFLSSAAQFFTNTTAKAYTKRKYRYIVARWGYSPALMAWELFNEVQFTDAAQNGQWSNVAAWHDEMASFIRSQDSYQHLITTSSDLSQSIWNQCDYYQHHDYPAGDLIAALRDPAGVPAGQPVKPVFGGECDRNTTPFYGFHAPLWAGLMSGQSGAQQQWYGDQLDANNAYSIFRAGRDFVLLSGIGDHDAFNKAAPKVTTAINSSLVFSPGGGWATNNGPDTFSVGDAAPDGIGTLPSYLQGNFHRADFKMTNGYNFIVTYPPGGGTFSVQIKQIAASGAGLLIYLDGSIVSSNQWPATGTDITTNLTISATVPAGQHTVRIYDQYQDWLLLGNITLNPYASILGAYQIGDTNFAALWVWHRTNIYYAGATTTVTGSFSLNGLQPGSYSGTWWDTFADAALSNFTFTVAGTNGITLPTPPILRSVAFFAGKAPQAAIAAPLLTQTLNTNSPPLTLPLWITNSGGLPLSYSLSVTGANYVLYSAINSTQTGGPMFAWKDISVVGRDLTTNFTPLAGPKTAKDEGIAGPIDIGFPFPFFSGAQSPDTFTQLYVSPNGFVTFAPFTGDTSTNTSLPNAGAPANLIALLWDDLDLGSNGKVYALSDPLAGTFTLQFQNVLFKGTGSSMTCQLVLKTSGEILMQYKSVGVSNACTVGVQNAARAQGLQVAFNQNYVQTNLCVRLTPLPWFNLSAHAGLTPRSNVDLVNLTFDPRGLMPGPYTVNLLLNTADPAMLATVLPVTLNIPTPLTPIEQWRLANFGTTNNAGPAADAADPDGDGLINIFEYAFNTSPTNANASPVITSWSSNHLTLTFNRTHPPPADITYLFEVSDDLLSDTWQSGPAYVGQNATDNGNGTETVVVTDLASPPSSPTHFIRLRLAH